MKTLKRYGKLLIILILLFTQVSSTSQGKISLSVYQDARLIVLGDKQSNKAGTMDLLMNMKIQTKQKNYGYLVIVPEYEQADLQDTYKRLSLGVGYTFNRLMPSLNFLRPNMNFLRDFEVTTTVYYGVINRFSNTDDSWSVSCEMSYKINEWLKFGFLHQLTERTDLLFRYQDKKIRYSFFFGLEFSPFDFGKRSRDVMWYASL